MKILFRILLALVVLLLLAVWSPWRTWDTDLPALLGYESPERLAGLNLTSLAGNLLVTIDGEQVGTADPNLELFQIEPGERLIRLQRGSEPAGFYEPVDIFVEFAPGLDVVIGYELGPNSQTTESHVLSASEFVSADGATKMNFDISPVDARVYLNDLEVEGEVADLDLSTQYTVRVEKLGYESLEFVILPDNQGDRDKLAGHTLDLQVQLMQIPI